MGEYANDKARNEFAQELMCSANEEYLGYKSRYALLRIQPGLWQIIFYLPVPVNCWLVAEGDGLTMIDAAQPWNAQDVISIVKLIGLPLRKIIITHAHPDHAGAAAHLQDTLGASVFAHHLDVVPFLTQQGSMHNERGFWLCRTVLGIGHKLGILTPPAVGKVETVGENEFIGSLQIVHTPGHTPGSISVWWEEQKALFCGDNVINSFNALRIGSPWFTLDLKTQRESIQKYIQLGPTILLSGHGSIYRGDVAGAVRKL